MITNPSMAWACRVAAILMAPALILGYCQDRLSAAAPLTHYRVEADVYLRNEDELCKQAWGIALKEFGPGIAETVTMSDGKFDTVKCLSVVYQSTDMGSEIVRAGIYVRAEK